MPTLSISMIVKNEESCLDKCLKSVVGADELVIVDTGSKDRTMEIASSHGAKLYEFPWVDDFAAARNHAQSKCTGDWILSIDADEVLEPGSLDAIYETIEEIERTSSYKTIYIRVVSVGGIVHLAPRVHKRCPEMYWKGKAHNYLVIVENHQKNHPANAQITYSYSEAHKLDPDRTLRILTKVLKENPKAVRETYYLAREYWDRKDYVAAAELYRDYLSRGTWAAEMSDAWLMLAYCLWNTRTTQEEAEEARNCILQAIKINADFKEALLFMAETSGPKNREKWKILAEFAKNREVMFTRTPVPKASSYYNKLFSESKDMSRYEQLLKTAASWTWGHVLDVCCGTGNLGNYITDYKGIDFSLEATNSNPRLKHGDVFVEDLSGYDTYVMLEALEHIDDIALLRRLPAGADIVFSVPNFSDPSHVRTYNEEILKIRFSELIDIERIVRFNWAGEQWDKDCVDTPSYILLVRARIKRAVI